MKDMNVVVREIADNGVSTIRSIHIDGVFKCWDIADTKRKEKIKGITRVTACIAEIKIRKEGGQYNRYKDKLGPDFEGMLCVTNAPDWKLICDNGQEFKYIQVHPGNSSKDTAGCLCPNYGMNALYYMGNISLDATKMFYSIVTPHLMSGERCFIQYVDL